MARLLCGHILRYAKAKIILILFLFNSTFSISNGKLSVLLSIIKNKKFFTCNYRSISSYRIKLWPSQVLASKVPVGDLKIMRVINEVCLCLLSYFL